MRLADLTGKRVNIGNPGSGQRGTMESAPLHPGAARYLREAGLR